MKKSIAALGILGGLWVAAPAQAGLAGSRPLRVIHELDAYYHTIRKWPLEIGSTPPPPGDMPADERVWAHAMDVRWTCDPAHPYDPGMKFLADQPKSLTYVFCIPPPNGNPQKVIDPRGIFVGKNPWLAKAGDFRPILKKIGRQASDWRHVREPVGSVVYVHATWTEVDVRYSSGTVLRLTR